MHVTVKEGTAKDIRAITATLQYRILYIRTQIPMFVQILTGMTPARPSSFGGAQGKPWTLEIWLSSD
jgi:hypothetical protein